MADGSIGNPAIDAVLSALERLVADLQRRTEHAEARAVASEKLAAEERQAREAEAAARRDAEIRAAAAEQRASEAAQRAEASEAAARESAERSHGELLAAAWKAVEAAQGAAAAAQPARVDRQHLARAEASDHWADEQETPHATRPLTGNTHGSSRRPMPHRRDENAGYAWTEDDPGPSWWSRLFNRRRY